MCIVCVFIWLMPLLTPAADFPPELRAASVEVDCRIAAAVDAARQEQPAWAKDVRAKLADRPAYAHRLVNAVYAAGKRSGLDPALLWSVAYAETHGQHRDDRGRVKRGNAGEIGLMQIKPFWQRALMREYGVKLDLYKLEDNLLASTYILKRGGSDPRMMLSYYNTGQRLRSTSYERRVMRYLKKLG
jgi:soluble lytic murein transglycosylase-like protein